MGAVIVAGRTVPRPPEDDIWQANANYAPINAIRMPIGGGFPFIPTRWRFNYDDASYWVNASVALSPVSKLVGGNFPFVPTRWRFNNDDPPVTSGAPQGPNRNLELASNLPVSKPPYWKFDTDDPGNWRAASQSVNRVIDLALSTPFTPARWKLDNDDSAVWYTKPGKIATVDMPPSPAISMAALYRPNPPLDDVSQRTSGVANLLLNAAIAAPLTPSRWKLDYDDAARWYSKPGAIPLLNLPISSTVITMASLYRPNPPLDDVWTGRRPGTSILGFPASSTQAIPMAGVYRPNPPEDQPWSGEPQSANWILSTTLQLYAPAGESVPDSASDEFWSYQARAVNNLLLNAGPFIPPLTPSFWKFNHDQPGFWSGAPVNVSIIQQLVIATPLVPQRWKFNNDDPAVTFPVTKPINLQLQNILPPQVTARAVGWPDKRLTRKRWEELFEEERAAKAEPTYEEFERLIKPSKSKKAIKARKEAVRAAVEAVEDGLLSELNAKPLVEAINKTLTASQLVDVLEYALQAREYIDRLREEDDEETVLKLAMTLL